MTIARGCVKTLSRHGRYGKAGTTAALVLQCLNNVACPMQLFFHVDVSGFLICRNYSNTLLQLLQL